ncbi:hypothetical protein DMA12_11155 [Amycolatopsis balhimycina DSM 5908]|uniref:Secreted protein n=1 Tax=Amycolatopsis balhimycina DSM 5908 TaxID=1081091 RepID=A0A428WTF1_AMYBA|nr:hypothetical protein DMA12_11155 [Amycolatopsis balhimycina DSM 5908]
MRRRMAATSASSSLVIGAIAATIGRQYARDSSEISDVPFCAEAALCRSRRGRSVSSDRVPLSSGLPLLVSSGLLSGGPSPWLVCPVLRWGLRSRLLPFRVCRGLVGW